MTIDPAESRRIQHDLEPWARLNVVFPARTTNPCRQVKLCRLAADREVRSDVTSIPVSITSESVEDSLAPLLRQIAEAVLSDAVQEPGEKLYALYAFYDPDKHFTTRKLFRVPASD